MTKSFPITDPLVLPQYNKILNILYKKYKSVCAIAYHSNWYLVIACTDEVIRDRIINSINSIDQWDMESRIGKMNRYHYIQLKFKQR